MKSGNLALRAVALCCSPRSPWRHRAPRRTGSQAEAGRALPEPHLRRLGARGARGLRGREGRQHPPRPGQTSPHLPRHQLAWSAPRVSAACSRWPSRPDYASIATVLHLLHEQHRRHRDRRAPRGSQRAARLHRAPCVSSLVVPHHSASQPQRRPAPVRARRLPLRGNGRRRQRGRSERQRPEPELDARASCCESIRPPARPRSTRAACATRTASPSTSPPTLDSRGSRSAMSARTASRRSTT